MGGGPQKKEEENQEIVENGGIPPAEKDGQQQQDQDHHHHDQFDIEFVIRSLEAALANEKHTQLGPYINAFAELKKLFSHLGVVFSFVETDLTNKHGILKDLSAKDQHNYATIERMVYYECFNGYDALAADGKNDQTHDATENDTTTKIEENGTLNNDRADTDKPMVATAPKAAGSRTLLRLHRALAFLMRLVEVVQRPSTEPTSNLFRKVYAETLSKHHTWYIRASVQCASAMVPNRAQLVQHIFGVNDKTGDEPDAAELSQEQERIDQIAQRFLQVTKQAYDRVQEFYERHGILELP